VPKALWLKRDEMSVRDYYGGILGKGNYERLMRHALAAVPSQYVDDFPANMLFKSRPRRKDIMRSYSLTGGLQSPLNEVARLPGVSVETNARVASIDRSDDLYQVRCEDGRTFESDVIGMAAPCPVATGLLGYVAPGAASALSEIESTSIDSMGVVVPADAISFEPIAGLIAVDECFFSVVSRDVVKDEKRRGFTFHFRPGTDETTRVSAIERVLETDQFLHRASASHTLPSPRMGHSDRVSRAEAALPAGCFLLGNYFEGLSMEDCVQRSFMQVNQYVTGT
jgi:protoporphyrinogen oxidase